MSFILRWSAVMLVCAACGSAPAAAPKTASSAMSPSTGAPVRESTEAECGTGPYKAEDTIALREMVARPVSWKDTTAGPDRLRIKLLGFNDFHGQLATDIRVEDRPVGGAAVLAAYFEAAMKGAEESAVIVHAGDLVGASPPSSALHQDEPTVTFLDSLANQWCGKPEPMSSKCNVVTALGNHELDEGVDELTRLLSGGEFGKSPFLGQPYTGARFPMLASNVVDAKTGTPFLPPFAVREIGGARIGFVGAVLRDAGKYLLSSGVASIRFEPEGPAIQNAVDTLKQMGVRAIILVVHQGGEQVFDPEERKGEPRLMGPIVEIVSALDAEVDLVVSGHSHSPFNALLENAGGRPTLVTQAFSAGTAFADIDLEIDATTGDIVGKSSRIVTTWADEGPGLTPDPKAQALVDAAESAVRKKTREVVTEASDDYPKKAGCDGESAIGNLIADAERSALGADIAFIQPSWIRAGPEKGEVTYGDLFAVQPFGNRVVLLEMTGRQIRDLLNEQWKDPTHSRILSPSGLSFTWDPDRPVDDRIVEVRVAGGPLDPSAVYTVAVNEFLAQGGELFSTFTAAKRKAAKTTDLEALVRYLKARPCPITPKLEGRVLRVNGHP